MEKHRNRDGAWWDSIADRSQAPCPEIVGRRAGNYRTKSRNQSDEEPESPDEEPESSDLAFEDSESVLFEAGSDFFSEEGDFPLRA